MGDQLCVQVKTVVWSAWDPLLEIKISHGGKKTQMNGFDGKKGDPDRKSCSSTRAGLLLGVEFLMSPVESAVHTLLPQA